jgi:hypothetical protein
MSTHTTQTINVDLLVAAAAVAAACTPRRKMTLRDEHGPIRGRQFLSADVVVGARASSEDRSDSRRAQLAWEIAG